MSAHRLLADDEQMFQAWVKKFKDDPQVEAVFLELNETNNRIMSAVPTVESDQQ